MGFTKMMILIFSIFSSLQSFLVSSFEYQVGDIKGWVIPPANDTNFYNNWASQFRFQVGDTAHFKYKKDSVLEVNEEDYKKCNSSHPSFFSNTANTVYKLDHPGDFFFISGVAGHCEKGQKMIIRVMLPEDEYPNSSKGKGGKNSAASHRAGVSNLALLPLLALSYVSASYLCQY